jgi:hypothetical protein
LLLIAAGLTLAVVLLASCAQGRKGGELKLKHAVTVATPEGERTFSSTVSMDGIQSYNYGAGHSGWGGISCRLTGSAVRVPVDGQDFYFLLAKPRTTTPAWTQIGLIKTYFGLPNHTNDDSWVAQWKDLARGHAAVDLAPEDFPAIAVMPHNGWMNDARIVSLEEAEKLGLRVTRYRLQITQDPVAAIPAFEVRYRPSKERYPRIAVGREYFSEVNGRA